VLAFIGRALADVGGTVTGVGGTFADVECVSALLRESGQHFGLDLALISHAVALAVIRARGVHRWAAHGSSLAQAGTG
jgi:uncharacterized membrane protein (UPF0136 family)